MQEEKGKKMQETEEELASGKRPGLQGHHKVTGLPASVAQWLRIHL